MFLKLEVIKETNDHLDDGANFMDVSKLKVMIGHEGLIYGSGIATSRGQDGIMPEEVKSKVGGME